MTIARQRATNARSAPIWRSPATPRAAMLTTNPFDDDKLREECGVFGVSGAADSAAALVALGLHALQHRGQEAAEIGRAHVCTPVTNAHLVCRLLLETKNNTHT